MRLLLLLLALSLTAPAQTLDGRWDAVIDIIGLHVPFRFDIAGSGDSVRGSFFNGDERLTSSSGQFDRRKLVLRFDIYTSVIEATLKDGALDGTYTRGGQTYPIHATPHRATTGFSGTVPSIAGSWEIQNGATVWPMVVRQSGREVTAAILRVDGDTGALTGTYQDGKFILSHFSGSRPALLELTPRKNGSFAAVFNGKEMLAVRTTEARIKGVPEPEDPAHHTTMKNPSERFHFAFPDVNGKLVSDTDARFQGKVVVAIGGSWCPNCHDEAPFLGDLYRKYHGKGLEIVELSFEDTEELKDPVRVRAYIKRYGIVYPVLLAGETSELQAKIPQAAHLDSYPTTFFLGRDGRVRSIHAGFAGAATGPFHTRLIAETTSLVEGLLAER